MSGQPPNEPTVCEVAIVRAVGDRIERIVHHLVRPPVSMSEEAARVTGIADEDLAGAEPFEAVAAEVAVERAQDEPPTDRHGGGARSDRAEARRREDQPGRQRGHARAGRNLSRGGP